MNDSTVSYRPVAGYLIRLEKRTRRSSATAIALAWAAGFLTGALVALLAR
jgi:hypothetical protein